MVWFVVFMFLMFTPFTFFFLFLYFIFVLILFYISDFFLFWVIIECSNIIFMGIAYSLLGFGFSNLIVYFIIQAVSSVNILVFYSLSFDFFLLLFLFLKLAVFPFFFWYYVVVVKLNNFLFFLSSTFHKVPSFLIFIYFVGSYNFILIILCFIFTLFFSSIFMFNVSSFRSVLLFSSVGNNVWFLLSTFVSFDFFLLFFGVYVLNFYLRMVYFGRLFSFLKINSFFSLIFFIAVVLSVAGFPPFPVFFLKLYIFYSLLFLGSFRFVSLVLILLFAVSLIASYIRFLLSSIVNRFGVVSILIF